VARNCLKSLTSCVTIKFRSLRSPSPINRLSEHNLGGFAGIQIRHSPFHEGFEESFFRIRPRPEPPYPRSRYRHRHFNDGAQRPGPRGHPYTRQKREQQEAQPPAAQVAAAEAPLGHPAPSRRDKLTLTLSVRSVRRCSVSEVTSRTTLGATSATLRRSRMSSWRMMRMFILWLAILMLSTFTLSFSMRWLRRSSHLFRSRTLLASHAFLRATHGILTFLGR
jgi:hypothetical protein